MVLLEISFFEHFKALLLALPVERIIGFFYMLGILAFLLYLSFKHKDEFWRALRGSDGELNVPEMIIAICMIIYPNLILADLFLGLHASEAVFWSIDATILFALTGRVAINRFGGNSETKTDLEPEPESTDENKKE